MINYYNLNLIRLCSAYAKQNAGVKSTSDACLMLAIQILFDLVWQRSSLFIINFEQAEFFFSLKYFFFTILQ